MSSSSVRGMEVVFDLFYKLVYEVFSPLHSSTTLLIKIHTYTDSLGVPRLCKPVWGKTHTVTSTKTYSKCKLSRRLILTGALQVPGVDWVTSGLILLRNGLTYDSTVEEDCLHR